MVFSCIYNVVLVAGAVRTYTHYSLYIYRLQPRRGPRPDLHWDSYRGAMPADEVPTSDINITTSLIKLKTTKNYRQSLLLYLAYNV